MADSEIKRCCTCKQERPFTDFGPCRRSKDGRKPRCKYCRRIESRNYRENNREACAALIKAWAKRNPERRRASFRRYDAAHREERRVKSRIYKAANVDVMRERRRAWRKANPEKVAAHMARNYAKHKEERREFRRKNIDKYRVYWSRKKTKRLRLPTNWSRADVRWGLKYFGHSCIVCFAPFSENNRPQWDHWIPVTQENCPGTIPTNMVPLCGLCNRSKRNHDAGKWLLKKLGTSDAARVLVAVNEFFETVRSCLPQSRPS